MFLWFSYAKYKWHSKPSRVTIPSHPARRGCLASAATATVSVATFGPWLQELGLDALEKARMPRSAVDLGPSWKTIGKP